MKAVEKDFGAPHSIVRPSRYHLFHGSVAGSPFDDFDLETGPCIVAKTEQAETGNGQYFYPCLASGE